MLVANRRWGRDELTTFDADPALHASRLYFSIDPMGQRFAALEPGTPGEGRSSRT
jgi:hypothetical protein